MARRYPPPAERLAAKLERKSNGCLEWVGKTVHEDGYGSIEVDGKPVGTHRVAWELAHGPIPPGLCVLHHCDNPPCCEPYDVGHLFLGTLGDNNADKAAKGRSNNQYRGKAFCSRNHEFTEANTYTDKRTGKRACRTCRDAAMARWRIKQSTTRGQ